MHAQRGGGDEDVTRLPPEGLLAHAARQDLVEMLVVDAGPADLAAFLAVNHMRQAHGSDVTELHSFAGKSRGGLSGGTLATGYSTKGLMRLREGAGQKTGDDNRNPCAARIVLSPRQSLNLPRRNLSASETLSHCPPSQKPANGQA